MPNHTDEHGHSTPAKSNVAKRMRLRIIAKQHGQYKKQFKKPADPRQFNRTRLTRFLTKNAKGHFKKV